MVDFKQIIGRGTRVRDDYGKLYFTILDYTGSATRLFAAPEFYSEPTTITEEEIDQNGNIIEETLEESHENEFTEEAISTVNEPPLSDDSFMIGNVMLHRGRKKKF